MKRKSLIIAALAILATPTVCLAVPPIPGAYVSGFAGASFVMDTDVEGVDFDNIPFKDRAEFDPSINIGATGGFDFGYVRLEGEISYKQGDFSRITFQDGTRFSSPDGELGALGVMFNTFFDFHNNSPVTPYLGGGIGFAALHMSDTTARGVFLYPEDDATAFAYQAGGGLEIAINRQFSLDVGYRYFGTNKASFDSDFFNTELEFESHNVAVGFRAKF